MHNTIVNPTNSMEPEAIIFENGFNDKGFGEVLPIFVDQNERKNQSDYKEGERKIAQNKLQKIFHNESV